MRYCSARCSILCRTILFRPTCRRFVLFCRIFFCISYSLLYFSMLTALSRRHVLTFVQLAGGNLLRYITGRAICLSQQEVRVSYRRTVLSALCQWLRVHYYTYNCSVAWRWAMKAGVCVLSGWQFGGLLTSPENNIVYAPSQILFFDAFGARLPPNNSIISSPSFTPFPER